MTSPDLRGQAGHVTSAQETAPTTCLFPRPGGSGQALPHLDTVSAPQSSSRPDSSCSHTELTRQGALMPPGCRWVRRGQSRVPSLGPPAPASRGPCAFVKPGSKPTALLSSPKTGGPGTREEKDEQPGNQPALTGPRAHAPGTAEATFFQAPWTDQGRDGKIIPHQRKSIEIPGARSPATAE